MSVHSAGQVVLSVKLFAGNNAGGCRKDLVFVDFLGLCGGNKSKKGGSHRRKVGCGVNSGNVQRNLLVFRKNWASSVKSVLDVERVTIASRRQSSDPKPKAANLEDIISERGACAVGFIANLDNRASHEIVKDAFTAVGCMEHRGGCGADNDSGDGSGVMTSIPWDLFNSWTSEQGMTPFDQMHTGVGMVFLPKEEALLQQAQICQKWCLNLAD